MECLDDRRRFLSRCTPAISRRWRPRPRPAWKSGGAAQADQRDEGPRGPEWTRADQATWPAVAERLKLESKRTSVREMRVGPIPTHPGPPRGLPDARRHPARRRTRRNRPGEHRGPAVRGPLTPLSSETGSGEDGAGAFAWTSTETPPPGLADRDVHQPVDGEAFELHLPDAREISGGDPVNSCALAVVS